VNDEVAKQAVSDYAARIDAADAEALLAAEAFSYGVFDSYAERKVADIERRIEEQFRSGGTTEPTTGTET